MSTSNPALWRSKPSAIWRYAIAALSVAIALTAADVLTVLLHTEPIASSMLCAVIFVAWFCGLGPGLLAIVLALFAFHYYLSPATDSFILNRDVLSFGVAELPRLVLFLVTSLFVTFLSSAQRAAADTLRKSRDHLLAAMEDQKRTEEALRHSEMYLAEAQRLSRTGSFGWKVPAGEITWSEETFRIFGYEPAVTPTLKLILQRIHPEDAEIAKQTIDRAAKEGNDFEHEYRLLMPDGSIKYVHAKAHAAGDDSGAAEFVGALMDVTAARQAEDELHKAQTELAHATRVTALGELAASIAHEVNQPIAGVVTNAQACLRWLDHDVPQLDEVRSSLEWIVKDANRAGNVVRRVRALSKNADSQRAWLDINDVVNEATALVQRELAHYQVSLRTDLASALPMIRADRVQLQQVIINLVMNGIEAMQPIENGPRELLIRSRRNELGQVLLSVRDSGIGISPEDTDRLFNAFFSTKPNGMGMGLSICRSIVEAHGGRLSASGNFGPGATFQFALPVHEPAM